MGPLEDAESPRVECAQLAPCWVARLEDADNEAAGFASDAV